MALELPHWLTEPLSWIGMEFPKADEDKLFKAGQEWIAFGVHLAGVSATANAAAHNVLAHNEGDAIDRFKAWWEGEEGPGQRLVDDATAAMIIGLALILFAGIILALKIAFIIQLIILAVQVAQAIATAVPTLGASLAEIPFSIAGARIACRKLVKMIVHVVEKQIAKILTKAKNLLKKFKTKLANRQARKAAREFDRKMLDDLKKVNPNFRPPHPEYANNCTHCVQAYELRRRGLDAEATGLPPSMWHQGGRGLDFIENKWGRSFTTADRAQIENAFKEPGSRGVISIEWPGNTAHVFNVENVGGKVRFIDGQTASGDVSHYFSQGFNPKYLRLDDLPTPPGGGYAKPRG
ncbi:toxin glutamine deamidase domain-containing protein [Longispora sp. K20-0274]|uniref:toxin glutamine deamidase domain-containing protein n=1 Tax=Longispora sp. K20-0274 TaxID=3088255 RepID=UPI00399A164A